jgi:hypothetical protein
MTSGRNLSVIALAIIIGKAFHGKYILFSNGIMHALLMMKA